MPRSGRRQVTLGPRGRRVLMQLPEGPVRWSNVGADIASDFELGDRFANLGAQILKNAACEMRRELGDGSTTTLVVTQTLARAAAKAIDLGFDPEAIKQGIEDGVAAAARDILEQSRAVADEHDLLQVALTASADEEELATLAVKALQRIGAKGCIVVESGSHRETGLDVIEGMRLDQDWLSSHFMTDESRIRCELGLARVLTIDADVNSVQSVLPPLEHVAQTGEALLIVTRSLSQEVLRTLVVIRLRSGFRVAAIQAPGTIEERSEWLQDIAAFTNSKITGLASMDRADLGAVLGHAQVTISERETVLARTEMPDAPLLDRRDSLRRQLDLLPNGAANNGLERRLAALNGKRPSFACMRSTMLKRGNDAHTLRT